MNVEISSISESHPDGRTEIGAFSPAGLLVGEGVVGTGGRCGLAIWGDDPTTDKVDGLREGEELVGAERGGGAVGGDEVVEAAAVFVPELGVKGGVDIGRQ